MFQFKQFTIQQQNCAMKVGTDGVLLGAWARVASARRILDVGTGTGLIALMAAQRTTLATIDAIEIEKNAYAQACENVRSSAWNNRISVIHTSLQTFEPQHTYNVILSNPPFFSQSLRNPDSAKSTARHNHNLPPAELLRYAHKLLQPDGRIAVIYPVREAEQFLHEAHKIGLFPRRITRVIPAPGKEVKRLLVEISRQSTTCKETELCIETNKRHVYSAEYCALTKDFYLKMECEHDC
jgi:tRNA1Val (adenine37-N6)-methyltransferase